MQRGAHRAVVDERVDVAELEVELEEFAVFNTPEGVLNLDLLTELALKERLLALEATRDVFRLDLYF